jgi:hypothetical protein
MPKGNPNPPVRPGLNELGLKKHLAIYGIDYDFFVEVINTETMKSEIIRRLKEKYGKEFSRGAVGRWIKRYDYEQELTS